MHRSLPIFGLVLLIVCAGCLGGLGLGGSNDNQTTTTTTPTSTEPTQTATSTPSTTTTTATATTTTATQTASTTTATTTTAPTTTQPSTASQTTTVPTQTTARIDAPSDGQRFQARVTKIVDPTTVKIEHNGKTQTVDLIGVRVPDSGLIHKRALQTTKAQLEYSTVTLVTDPQVKSGSDGHPQMYVYTGNWLYNTQLLRTGYARVADGQFSKRAEFERKQQVAKKGGYGLWKNTTTTA